MVLSPQLAYDVDKLRLAEFPFSEEVTYLNHGSLSPLPRRSQEAAHHLITQLTTHPGKAFREIGLPFNEQFSVDMAHHINAADPIEIISVTNTETGINLVANAIDWQAGDNIVFCDYEFPSNAFPWMNLERQGVDVHMVPTVDGTLTVETLEEYVDENTRLVTVSAVQYFTGGIADLQALGNFCRERDILFAVDAIQSIGHMPIDVQKMNIDILAAGSQKSLMALPGAGVLYVRKEVAEAMHPTHFGSSATVNHLHWTAYDMTLKEGAQRFAQGMWNWDAIVTAVTSLQLIEELGIHSIYAHTTDLAQTFIDELLLMGLHVITPHFKDQHGPIVTFRVSDDVDDSTRILTELRANQVELTQQLDKDGSPFLRIAVHCYNNDKDRKRFIKLLTDII